MSLVELLVGIFLSSIMLTVLVKLFSVSYRVSHEELLRSSTESSLVLALHKLQKDLLSSTPAALSLDSTGQRLLAQPLETVTERRQLVYQPRFFYWSYQDTEKRVFRSELLSPPGGGFPNNLAMRVSEPDLQTLSLGGSGRTLFQVSKIENFQIENPPGVTSPNIGSPLNITIESRIEGSKTRPIVKFERKVWLKSGSS